MSNCLDPECADIGYAIHGRIRADAIVIPIYTMKSMIIAIIISYRRIEFAADCIYPANICSFCFRAQQPVLRVTDRWYNRDISKLRSDRDRRTMSDHSSLTKNKGRISANAAARIARYLKQGFTR